MNKEYQYLLTAALAGSAVLLKYFGQKIEKMTKQIPNDIVTIADLDSQEAIISSLKQNADMIGLSIDKIGFIAEEKSVATLTTDTFIIDPLDGTFAFTEGDDNFSISIAHVSDNEIISGLVYQPIKNIIYFSQKKQGAWKIFENKKEKLNIVDIPLNKMMVGFNTPHDVNLATQIYQTAIGLLPVVFRLRERPSGILALVNVADNRFGATLNPRLRIWDLAATKIIINEAGGELYDWDGKLLTLDFTDVSIKYSVIATTKSVINLLMPYVKKTG